MRQLDGLTPLHMAAMQRGGAAVAKMLLEAGADATLADNDGCTALHQALRLADHALFQTLHAALASAPPATDRRGEQHPVFAYTPAHTQSCPLLGLQQCCKGLEPEMMFPLACVPTPCMDTGSLAQALGALPQAQLPAWLIYVTLTLYGL